MSSYGGGIMIRGKNENERFDLERNVIGHDRKRQMNHDIKRVYEGIMVDERVCGRKPTRSPVRKQRRQAALR